MRLVVDSTVTTGWLVSKIRPPQLSGTFFVKGTYRLRPGAEAIPHEKPLPPGGDVHVQENPEKPLRCETDFVPFKPRADVVVVGTAHAPEGKKTSVLRVGFRAGRVQKAVAVIGRRAWKRGFLVGTTFSDPEMFTQMPIAYDRAYGGPGWNKNPMGIGREGDELPNIENPDRLLRAPSDGLDPAGFGPIARMWEQRLSLTGTYKAKWLKERWPWFPEDFDFAHFNSAPRDQQADYFKGDEELLFEHMNAAQPQYKSRLPGLRARCFLAEKIDGKDRWREVPLKLDTIWIDMDSETLVLVWRGAVDVRTLKLREIEHLFAFIEKLSESAATVDQARALFLKRLKGDEEPVEVEADEAAEDAAFEKEMGGLEEEFAKDRAEAAKIEEQANKMLVEAGLDPKKLAVPAEDPTAQTLKAALAQLAASIKVEQPALAAQILAFQPGELPAEDKEEPEEDADRKWTRDEVVAAVKRGHAFVDHDLSGLDLSSLDLSGANFAGASLSKANLSRTKLIKANLSKAELPKADLTEADLSGATLDLADFTGCTLTKAKFVEASLNDTEMMKCALDGADFSQATGKGIYFTSSALAGASFKGATLPLADFEKADITGADFTGAKLRAACVESCKGAGAIFTGADLTSLKGAPSPDFTGAKFQGITAEASVWTGAKLDKADFTGAKLARADFEQCSAKATVFLRADLTSAVFADASLMGAILRDANLMRANFERADLTEADLGGANAFEAEFWETKIERTHLQGANLKNTKLS